MSEVFLLIEDEVLEGFRAGLPEEMRVHADKKKISRHDSLELSIVTPQKQGIAKLHFKIEAQSCILLEAKTFDTARPFTGLNSILLNTTAGWLNKVFGCQSMETEAVKIGAYVWADSFAINHDRFSPCAYREGMLADLQRVAHHLAPSDYVQITQIFDTLADEPYAFQHLIDMGHVIRPDPHNEHDFDNRCLMKLAASYGPSGVPLAMYLICFRQWIGIMNLQDGSHDRQRLAARAERHIARNQMF